MSESVAAFNPDEPAQCTTCLETVEPPELPVLTWNRSVPRERGTPRPEPDHIEHIACNLRRVPRKRPATLARGAA